MLLLPSYEFEYRLLSIVISLQSSLTSYLHCGSRKHPS